MEIQSATCSLRNQMKALQHCNRTITRLEIEVHSLQKQCFISAIEDDQSRHLRLLQRLSVTEGVLTMYKRYSEKKQTQIQSLTQSIKSHFESATDVDEHTPSINQTSLTVRTTVDKAADQWSTIYCRQSRQA